MAVVKQELHCHNCQQYVQFDMDEEMDGEYEIECPDCGHMHCRVVEKGRITDKRWDSRNGNYMSVTAITYSSTSIMDSLLNYSYTTTCTDIKINPSSSASVTSANTGSVSLSQLYLRQSWANTTCGN